MKPRIVLDNVGKKFKIGYQSNQTFLSRVLHLISGKEAKKTFWALKNISLVAQPGEIIGIIGPNGAGKSTLLRIIARIYNPDEGTVKIDGKIASLISLEAGLKPRLSMRENIYLGCSLFGLATKEIKKNFVKIVEFSELKDFLETKLYQFSSGMIDRLTFAIAIYSVAYQNPDILLLDEAFVGGDEKFKKKAIKKLEELVKFGATVLLVSHNLFIIKKYCQKTIWLNQGQIVEKGKTEKVLKNYLGDYPKELTVRQEKLLGKKIAKSN